MQAQAESKELSAPTFPPQLIERFWKRVTKPSEDTCWEWNGALAGRKPGHGRIFIERKAGKQHFIYTHRLSWLLHNGQLPDDLHVLHKCDNTRCVNPKHLFLGTHQENMADMYAKGRHVAGRRAETTHCPAGHAYNDKNCYRYTDKSGRQYKKCRICDRIRHRKLNTERGK